MLRLRTIALVPLLTALWLVPSRAHGYERQWHAGASFGYGVLGATDTLHGFGGGLHLKYGLSDAFDAMAEIDLTAHGGGDVLVASGSLGASYVFDVLEWVPYVGVMVGGYDLWTTGSCDVVGAPACHDGRLGVSFPFGLDYRLTQSVSLGAAGRYHMLLLGPSPESHLTALARVEYVWGF